MTANQYRKGGKGGKGVAITYAKVETPFGAMMVGATDRGSSFVQFGSEPELLKMLETEYPEAQLKPMVQLGHPYFAKWVAALRDHLAGHQPHLNLPLDIRATAFQMKVRNYLRSIPYGAVESYAGVAAGVRHPKAARAVARACASNQVAVLIPCHRVILGTGKLGGYKWGVKGKGPSSSVSEAQRPKPFLF